MYTLSIATTTSELEAIFKLRYKLYIEAYGAKVPYLDLVNKKIIDPLDEGAINVAAWCDDQLAGCLRININNNDHFTHYRNQLGMDELAGTSPDKYCMATKFAVDPKHQHSRINVLLQQFSYKTLLENNLEYCFVECVDSKMKYYQKFGFKTYTDRSQKLECGTLKPMVLDILDIDHLREIRSPFVPIYETTMTENNVIYAQAA